MSPSRRPRPRRASLPAPPRARRRRKRSRGGGKRLVIVGLVALLVGAAAVATSAAVLTFRPRCNLDALKQISIGENTFVYAADGSLLGAIPAERNREVVPLREISPWLRTATVAIEDRRFYEHGGVDAEGIARALWRDVKAGRVVEGGSTITQQLVRTLYISNERTVERKITEACLAVKLDGVRSKDWILASYLNSVFYGNLAYGAEAAARTYFSRSARALTLPQAALLAGLTQAPSAYDPFADPDRARLRRNQVLFAMRELGMITQKQYRFARRSGLGLRPGRLYQEIREPYFFGYVREQLVRAYGAEKVRSGGLRVYTTIQPRWQGLAGNAIKSTLTRRIDPAAALISIDPTNGSIRAMTAIVPGRANNQFNLLSQARRQPGSTFKTFVLAAAVEQGMDPVSTYYVSAPFTYRPVENGTCERGWWCVKTYDSSYVGWSSVERATLRSDNSVFAQLTLDVGPARVASLARRLGVRTPLEVRGEFPPAMGLGSVAVSPLDMASAYATLAAGGVYTEPTAIRKVILPNGKPDDRWAARHRRTRVIPDGVAHVVTRILEDNIRYGTGTRAALSRPAAGKTGTTDKHADAWFVGYTPGLATAVWMGYTRGEIPMENVHGISVSGGSFPAEIWRRFMEPALAGFPAREFPAPRQPVEFREWNRGPHALGYDPYYVSPSPPPPPAPAEPEAPAEDEETPSGRSADGDSGPSTSNP